MRKASSPFCTASYFSRFSALQRKQRMLISTQQQSMVLQKELLERGKQKEELGIFLSTQLGKSQEKALPGGKRYTGKTKQAGMSRAAF